jgi:cytochrome c
MHGMNSLLPRPIIIALLAGAAGIAHADGDAVAGKALYATRCASCHSIDFNGVGPAHKNLIGRRAGTAPGYAYSDALKNSQVVWTEETLRRWLTDPEKFIPGQKMFISVPDAQERADIVAYLQQAGASAASASKPRKPGE